MSETLLTGARSGKLATEQLLRTIEHKGYERGVAAERKRHELRVWEEMPDVEGWYWFKGETWIDRLCTTCDPIWRDTSIDMVHVISGANYFEDYPFMEEQIRGTWRGPIPNPFEEASK